MLLLQNDSTLKARLPELWAQVRDRLDDSDSRRDKYLATLTVFFNSAALDDAQRIQIREIRRAVNEASDAARGNLRSFRNIIAMTFFVLTIAVAVVTLVQYREPGILAVCSGRSGCPSEEVTAQGSDLLAVVVAGSFGGLVIAVYTLSKLRGYGGTYDVPSFQALLKVPTGAVLAILASLLFTAGVTGIDVSKDSAKLLGYCALVGVAQQAFMRYVDAEAKQVLNTERPPADPA